MFVPGHVFHRWRSVPRRARATASSRTRAALAGAQPAAHRLQATARFAFAAGVVMIVLAHVPGWLGYQPREDASGGLALVSVAGAANAPILEATPALVIPVPHLASVVEAITSTSGRMTMLALPVAGLLAASALLRAGRTWPADRLPALPHSLPAAHRARFPQGAPSSHRAVPGSIEVAPTRPRAGLAVLSFIVAVVALAGLLGYRSPPRG